MTVYNGEYVRITNAATFDGATLTPTSGCTASITIYDPSNDYTITSGPSDMAWSADDNYWYFDWDTGGIPAGSYSAKCVVIGPGSHTSWEYIKVKLTADKVSLQPADQSVGRLDFTMRYAQPFTDTLTFANNGIPMDLTGYTFQALLAPLNSNTPQLPFTVSCSNPTTGQVIVSFSQATPTVTAGVWRWTLQWAGPGAGLSTVLVGYITMKDEFSV